MVGGGWSGQKGDQRRTTREVGLPNENIGAVSAPTFRKPTGPHRSKPEVAPGRLYPVSHRSLPILELSFGSLIGTLDHYASMKTQLSTPQHIIYMTRDYTAKYSVLAALGAGESQAKVSDGFLCDHGEGLGGSA